MESHPEYSQSLIYPISNYLNTTMINYNKPEIYRKIGVAEYWIVDLQERQVFQYLSSNDYVPQSFIHPEAMKTAIFSDLVIDFSSVMGPPNVRSYILFLII